MPQVFRFASFNNLVITYALLLPLSPLLSPNSGPLAIGISLVAAGLAAANLLLDLDWLEKASYQVG